MTRETSTDLPPCLIFIDKEARWYHKGVEMIHRKFIRLFYQNMELDSHGRYVINWEGERCYVEVEDTAFVVQRAVYLDGSQTRNAQIILTLSDDSHEELQPDTLYVGNHNVIYCRVKGRTFPARFSRAAYYQLAKYIEEENEAYYLPLNGKKYRISLSDPDPS
jgi:hypothetical protein